jgi:glutaredoxin 3
MYIVYGKRACPGCDNAKRVLTETQRPFKYIDCDVPENREELLDRVPDARTVPQIFYNEDYVGGLKELMAHIRDN